jgi:hypothetical protein
MSRKFKWLFLSFAILLFGCQANGADLDTAQGTIRRDDLVDRFGLPEGYTVAQILSPPVPEPRLARSESGLVYLGREDGRALFTLDLASGERTLILEPEDAPLGAPISGPGATVFVRVEGEIWQVHPDGSHEVWGQMGGGAAWCYTPDGRMIGVGDGQRSVVELFADGSLQELAAGFQMIDDMAASPDDTVFVGDVGTGEVVAIQPDGARRVVTVLSPDHTGLEVDDNGQLFVHNPASGLAMVNLDDGRWTNLDEKLQGCPAFTMPSNFVSPEPGQMVIASGATSQVAWVDLDTGDMKLLVSNSGANSAALDIGPDDHLYVGVSGCGPPYPTQVIRLADDGTRQVIVNGLEGVIRDIAFEPEGGLYILVNPDRETSQLYYKPEDGNLTEIPGPADYSLGSIAVHPQTGHLLASPIGDPFVAEFTLEGEMARHFIEFPKATMPFALDVAPDGSVYACTAEAERFFTGPVVERWILELDLQSGSSSVVAQIDQQQGCCPMLNLSVAPTGDIWWLVNPDFQLYQVTSAGEVVRFGQDLFTDPSAVAVDRQGDVYFTSSEGIFRIYGQ